MGPQQLSTQSATLLVPASQCFVPAWVAFPGDSLTSLGPLLHLEKADTLPLNPPSSSPLPTWPGCRQPGLRSRRSCLPCRTIRTVVLSSGPERTSSSVTPPTLWATATRTSLTATMGPEPHLHFFLATTMPPCPSMRSCCPAIVLSLLEI